MRIFVGYDAAEAAAYRVCVRSLLRTTRCAVKIYPLLEDHLRGVGAYQRPAGPPTSSAFTFTRYLVPNFTDNEGWALFCDSDFLWRRDVRDLFARADPRYAAMVVKHDHRPPETRKIDGQSQDVYTRKNWSSLILWNCEHQAHAGLSDVINHATREELHAFCWLDEALIGALPEEWNWLEGWSDPAIEPAAVHYTRGVPGKPYGPGRDAPFADEWFATLQEVADGLG